MRVIFISYADDNMSYSLKRIGRQARKLGVFDEVLLYTPEILPDYIKESPLMKYARGGGYWAWKPAIINEALQHADDGDIVVYVDAGCSLRKRKDSEWNLFIRLLQKYDTVCFQYDESQPQWEKWGGTSAKIKYWTKELTIKFFEDLYKDNHFIEECQIMGGILFIKNKDNSFLKNWLSITLNHPELIIDPTPTEVAAQPEGFAGHRHDQSIITPLAFYDKTVAILPEIFERKDYDSCIWASRIRAKSFIGVIIFQVKSILFTILGDSIYKRIKSLIK